jgi:hypothetical protein
MFANLALGTVWISATVIIHTLGLNFLATWMTWMVRWFKLHKHYLGKLFAVTTAVLGIFFLHGMEIWLWAFAFDTIGAIQGFDTALYFSTVTFSTVGYGDVTPTKEWRLFAALEAIDGFILIGWSIAFLLASATRHGPFRIGEHV